MSNEKIHSSQIGLRIRTARKKKRITQTELANILGKSLRTIQKYESGEIEVTVAMLIEIADILDCGLAYLVGYDLHAKPLSDLADVANFFCMLDRIEDINFEIETQRPPRHGSWECTIKFKETDDYDYLTPQICYFLDEFEKMRQEVRTGKTTVKDFLKWQDQVLALYSVYTLTEKENP